MMEEYKRVKEEYLNKFGYIPVELNSYPKEELTKIFKECLRNNKDAIEMGYYKYDKEFYL